VLVASLITSLRLSSDRETEGWMSLGVSFQRIMLPALWVGCLSSALCLFLSLWVQPFAAKELKKFKWMHARQSVEAIIENKLKEKIILTEFFPTKTFDITMHVDKVSAEKKDFSGVFLALRRSKSEREIVLHAQSGSLAKQSENGLSDYVFTVKEGSFSVPAGSEALIPGAETSQDPPLSPSDAAPLSRWTVVHFEEMKISLIALFQKHFDPGQLSQDDIRSLYPVAYWQQLQKHRSSPDWGKKSSLGRDYSYFYEQWVVSLACLILPILGLGLGIRDPRQKAGASYLGLGLVVLGFYSAVMICQRLSMRFLAPPEVSLVLPLLFLILVLLIMMHWRTTHPPSTRFKNYLSDLVFFWQKAQK